MTTTKTRKREHLTAAEREARQLEALNRARTGNTCENDMIIMVEFATRGIDAHPRVDCLTFNAWKALHRHVRKGEHGVCVPVYFQKDQKKDDGTTEQRTIRTGAVVFHISQTDPDEEKRPADEDKYEAELLKQEQEDEAQAQDAGLF